MKMRWMSICAALVIAIASLTAASPTMTIVGEHIQVTFDKGAVGACTVYYNTAVTEVPSENFPDGHYAPRHCWLLDGESDLTGYTDDWAFIEKTNSEWDVYAEVGYVNADQTVSYVESNKVRVRR